MPDAVIGRDPARAEEAADFIGAAGRGSTCLGDACDSDLVLLAVPDNALGTIARQLAETQRLHPQAVLIHFSGIHPASILRDQGDSSRFGALSIHPLQSFADPERGYRALDGVPCAIEGDEHLLALAQNIAQDLGGVAFTLKSDQKALYHAAACIASNYLVTLVDAAEKVLGACNFSADEARRLLGPLLQTTARNIAETGATAALTGPIARGDTRTVHRHLQDLDAKLPEQARLYRLLGQLTVDVAKQKGTLSATAAQELEREIL